MPTIIDDTVMEKSTCKVTCTFRDENGTLFTPKTLTKTLSDMDGNIINSVEDEVVAPTGSTMDFILSGADLPWPVDSNQYVVLLLKGTYDSVNGSDLDFADECRIPIANLVKQV